MSFVNTFFFLASSSIPLLASRPCRFLNPSSCNWKIKSMGWRILPHQVGWLVDWLCNCLTSNRQRGHLETAHPFTVPFEGREARYIHRSDRELNPGPSHGSPLRYRCATQAPLPHQDLTTYTQKMAFQRVLVRIQRNRVVKLKVAFTQYNSRIFNEHDISLQTSL